MAITLNPITALAGNQFVTAEAVRFEEGGQVVASLSVGNSVQADADGFLSFEGQILSSNGTVIPLTIRVQTAGRDAAPSIEEFAEVTGRVALTAQTAFSPSIEGVEIEKTIYTLTSNVDGSVGSITITDEPLPAVAGWLAFAALASFTGISIIVLTDDDGPCGEKLSASISADLNELKGEVSVTCERQ